MSQTTLGAKHCEACQVDAPKVSEEMLPKLMQEIPSWTLITDDKGIHQLEKLFKFKNYKDALAFTNRLSELAEAEGHHPAILLEWGKARVSWWSHSIKGLHLNDFIMAAKTDKLLEA